MASANIYSIENPPDFEFFANNKNGKDIRCLNYVFRLKTAGKRSWNYLCSSHNCTASLSLQLLLTYSHVIIWNLKGTLFF